MEITKDIAEKVLSTVDKGLVKGLGIPIPGEMCVEAAVCYAQGLPHSDEPSCVSPAIRSLKITLNDADWSSKTTRAKGMRRLALAQLGSAGAVNDNVFADKVAELSVRKTVPAALRSAAMLQKDPNHKSALLDAATLCEKEGTRAAVWAPAWAARAAAAAGGRAAKTAGAVGAAWAAWAAAEAAEAAGAAKAAWAARAARAAAEGNGKDKILSDFAEDVVQILIEMQAPGCQWLYLTEGP